MVIFNKLFMAIQNNLLNIISFLFRFKNGEVVIPDLRISVHTNEEGQVKSTLTIDHFSNLDITNVRLYCINCIKLIFF